MIKLNSFVVYAVCIVQGGTLRENWSHPMQKVYTSEPGMHEFYVDNMPGKQFGYHDNPDAAPGFDWAAHIGKTVATANIIKSDGFDWINKNL